MIHLIFDRPSAALKVYDGDGSLWRTFVAAGDAWGNHGFSDDGTPPAPPYGHACWMPPGHYMLGAVQVFDTPSKSEGYGQIPVIDLDADTIRRLLSSGKATKAKNGQLQIGPVLAWTSQLAEFARGGIMIHCGGSRAPDPYADLQGLYRTIGCTRMQNVDWRALAAWLAPKYAGNTVVYSAFGDPPVLAQ
jgi:hypothetical protein